VSVDNLLITAVRALCFMANVFIDSCAICFGDYLDSYAAFAEPRSNSINHKSKPTEEAALLSKRTSIGFRKQGIATYRS
jgi:hypothetical protein